MLRFSAVAWQATCGPEFTECNQEAALLFSGIQFRVNLDCSSVLSVAEIIDLSLSVINNNPKLQKANNADMFHSINEKSCR